MYSMNNSDINFSTNQLYIIVYQSIDLSCLGRFIHPSIHFFIHQYISHLFTFIHSSFLLIYFLPIYCFSCRHKSFFHAYFTSTIILFLYQSIFIHQSIYYVIIPNLSILFIHPSFNNFSIQIIFIIITIIMLIYFTDSSMFHYFIIIIYIFNFI